MRSLQSLRNAQTPRGSTQSKRPPTSPEGALFGICPNPKIAWAAFVRSQVITERLMEKTSWLEEMKFLKEKPTDSQGAQPLSFFLFSFLFLFFYFFFPFSLINHSSHCLFCRNLFSAVAVGFASCCYAQGGKKQPNFSAICSNHSAEIRESSSLLLKLKTQGKTSLFSGCMCRLSLDRKVQLLTSQLSQEGSLM